MQNFLMIRVIGLNVAIGLRQRCSEFKKERNQMPLVNSFDDYLTRADITVTISQLDRIACLFVAILHRKYSQWYNNQTLYIP